MCWAIVLNIAGKSNSQVMHKIFMLHCAHISQDRWVQHCPT